MTGGNNSACLNRFSAPITDDFPEEAQEQTARGQPRDGTLADIDILVAMIITDENLYLVLPIIPSTVSACVCV